MTHNYHDEGGWQSYILGGGGGEGGSSTVKGRRNFQFDLPPLVKDNGGWGERVRVC